MKTRFEFALNSRCNHQDMRRLFNLALTTKGISLLMPVSSGRGSDIEERETLRRAAFFWNSAKGVALLVLRITFNEYCSCLDRVDPLGLESPFAWGKFTRP